MTELKEIEVLKARLERIGISVEFNSCLPWIWLSKINGIPVTEKSHSDHGWTIAFLSIKGNIVRYNNLRTTFKLIRKYINEKKL